MVIHLSQSPYDATGEPFDQTEGKFSTLAVILRPQSTGNVRIVSSDTDEPASIDLATLTDPHDWDVMRTAVRLSVALFKEMRAAGHQISGYRVPASDSDADIDAHIKRYARTTYHYSSTCRMAPEDDPKPGVVDDELRVHGLRGLRIADSSIFPQIPATHLQAPAVMVAEKCAAMIRASHVKK